MKRVDELGAMAREALKSTDRCKVLECLDELSDALDDGVNPLGLYFFELAQYEKQLLDLADRLMAGTV